MNLLLLNHRRDYLTISFFLAAIVATITPSIIDASEAENAIHLGDTIFGTIDPIGDEDTFGFDAIAGTVVSFNLKVMSENGVPPELRLLGPNGVSLNLTPFIQIRITHHAVIVSLKKLPLAETGSYVLTISIPFDCGEYRLATLAKFPHRIRERGHIVGGQERSLTFHALAESKVTIAIRKARYNPLALEIVSLSNSAGETLQIGNFAISDRRGAVLKSLKLNQLDAYQLRFRNTSAASGIYKIEGTINPPKRRHQRLVAKEPDINPTPNVPQQIWKFEITAPVRSKPFTDGDAVYVGANDGRVYALDAEKGNMLWQYETGEPVISSPNLSNDIVYVGCNNHNVYALDKTNGSLIWVFETGGIVQSSPAVEGNSVFVGSYDGFVYALDTTTGQLLWRFQTGGLIWTSGVVVDGTLFIGSTDGYLYALNADNGELVWRYTTSWNYIISDPIVKDGTVYVAAYEERVYALDAATGTLKWVHYGGNWITTLPFLRGDVLYYGVAAANTLYALNISTGLPIWQSNVLEARQTILFEEDSLLYAMSKGGILSAIDFGSGEIKAVYELGILLNALCLSEDGKIFISSENDGVLAFSL